MDNIVTLPGCERQPSREPLRIPLYDVASARRSLSHIDTLCKVGLRMLDKAESGDVSDELALAAVRRLFEVLPAVLSGGA
jgi:hypothetical protein